jgi:FAD/FMN-containing dehydrogenase/Fe-S oxidoreductase
MSIAEMRREDEALRFERENVDDSRTAISTSEVELLAASLRGKIQGEVRFDAGSRALYATDGSNYRQVPMGIAIPRTSEDVEAIMKACRSFGVPVLSRGCGTSLAGQCCNVAVVMDFSKYLGRVLEIDAAQKLGRVQPGCVLDDLRKAAEGHGLMFAPDPATHTHCTLGGMLGNNSCGIHSLLAAKHGRGLRTADNTHELEVLTYRGTRMRVGAISPDEMHRKADQGGPEGEIYAKLRDFIAKYENAIRDGFPKLPRRVSGYNLDALLPENGFQVAQALVGSESTLVTILEATLNLVPNPLARSLLVLGYPDVYAAANDIMDILPLKPTGLEGMDHLLFQWTKKRGGKSADLSLMPPGQGFLMVEFGGDSKEDSDSQARHCMEILRKKDKPPEMKLFDDPHEEHMVWEVRESGLGSTAWVSGQPDTWPGWEDSAVPPDKVAEYLPKLRELFTKYGYHPSLYGHFGQGCIHCRVGFDLYSAEGVRKFRSFMDEAADLVVSLGGALSGEHGDGQARGELLPKMYGPELMQAFREFKTIWDPDWKMNPGKKIDAYPITENLRLGADYNPPELRTHFQYPQDKFTFARAALRCVGVGNCRRHGGGVMCPSYQATREEKDSTRGRARMLFEMMNGEVIKGGWRSEEVKDALDLCLACKGCKGDCPVNVDMATYKSEFLSHYYEGRLRPRYAYSMGLIHVWARLASIMPRLANFFSQTPGLRNLAKWLGGIAQERDMPPFATETFQAWFRRRGPRNQGKPPVILWPDTFNNYFHPEVAKAGVEVLEAAGFQVQVPQASICCGRPLYDYGMLDMAKAWLEQILDALRPQIDAGVPLVGLEPSCLAVFRDELIEMFPNRNDAQRLSKQCFVLSEFLEKKATDFHYPNLSRKALVWGHCHHRSVMGMEAEEAVLKKMGVDYHMAADATCCGMAGSFGFEADHVGIANQIGELGMLPKVRQAEKSTIIIADGFSCQTMIEQGKTGRQALHLAQVLQMGLHEDGHKQPPKQFPERDYPKARGLSTGRLLALTAAGIGLGLVIISLSRKDS